MLLSVLRYLVDGKGHTPEEIRRNVSSVLEDGDQKSGNNSTRLKNWVAFALKNLQRAEAIVKVGPHEYQINRRGRDLLDQGHASITIEILKQYPEMCQSLHIAAMKAGESRT